MTTETESRTITSEQKFVFAVIGEYLAVVLSGQKFRPELLRLIGEAHRDFRFFIALCRDYMDGTAKRMPEHAQPGYALKFSLLMEAVQSTAKRKILTKETLHKHLRTLIAMSLRLGESAHLCRNELAVLERLARCLAHLKTKEVMDRPEPKVSSEPRGPVGAGAPWGVHLQDG